MADKIITEATAAALQVLQDHGYLAPRQFAKLRWPDSPKWQKATKCGPSGAHRGGGMYTAAGGLLGKLAGRGLVRRESRGTYDHGYVVTTDGKLALAKYYAAEHKKDQARAPR